MSRRHTGAPALALFALLGLASPAAPAAVVEHGYLPLKDGTQLNYTLTRPDGDGRFPVVIQYDPYDSGVISDPRWAEAGYAMLGVNMRGSGCSQGVFEPLRTDIWGADGAEVVDWAAAQPWASGAVGMIGYSFTGVSQLATAAFAGPALKAITPGNVFLDFYRDSIYPGGIHNGWIPAWIAAGRQFVVGTDSLTRVPSDPACALNMLLSQPQAAAQTLDTQSHPYDDSFWATQPASYLDRVHIPVLGCVNWQDTTIYSRAGLAFRDRLPPATTWLVGGNGSHSDCPISWERQLRFFDRYLKGERNGWEATPRVVLMHEVAGAGAVNQSLRGQGEAERGWDSDFRDFAAMTAAIRPLSFFLREGGRLALERPAGDEAADTYMYPLPTSNTPPDFAGLSFWNNPRAPAGVLTYTTPALGQDLEFLGSGSADLWLSSTAADTDVQVTLIELRPDGQELYVQNGWLRLSHRRLDEAKSTALQPYHTHRQADAQMLTPGEPVFARIELLPLNHVFRKGSALRLEIDAPGGYFQILPQPAVNTVHHTAERPSALVLGWLPGGRAQSPLPECGTLRNQPCRASSAPMPPGELVVKNSVAQPGSSPARRSGGGGCAAASNQPFDPLLMLMVSLSLLALRSRERALRQG